MSDPVHATRGAVLVGGTASGVGKSLVVTALCRWLAREGVAVAPFKAQNMSNQSAVTADGAEIGRAQYAQALAAGVEPEAAMNPVLLKPVGETTSQVVVLGRAAGIADASGYGDCAPDLLPVVLDALASLRQRFAVVVAEGAGGAAEVNLLDRDIVNLPLADAAGIPALLVADVDRGGVFASAYGTIALLPPHLRRRVRGIVVNKLRGDAALLAPGLRDLERRTGVPVLGVLPMLGGAAVDEEDSLDFATMPGRQPAAGTPSLDVAVVRLPRLANVTDVEPLLAEPDMAVRFVGHRRQLGRPDLIVLPGSKATVTDLAWLRATGLADVIDASDAMVLGICAGYQVLGRTIRDDGVESGGGTVGGLGRLPVDTVFAADKVVRRRRGSALGEVVGGYELRHGRVTRDGDAPGWVELVDDHGRECEGAVSPGGRWWGTSVHGLFENDGFRRAFLALVAARAGAAFVPGEVSFGRARGEWHDRLADVLVAHVDMDAVRAIIAEGVVAG